MQFEARAKWDAWSALKGMSKAEAMQASLAWGACKPQSTTNHMAGRDQTSLQALQHTAPTRALLQKYIDLVAEGDPNWEGHEALKEYKEDEQQ